MTTLLQRLFATYILGIDRNFIPGTEGYNTIVRVISSNLEPIKNFINQEKSAWKQFEDVGFVGIGVPKEIADLIDLSIYNSIWDDLKARNIILCDFTLEGDENVAIWVMNGADLKSYLKFTSNNSGKLPQKVTSKELGFFYTGIRRG